MMTKKKNNKSSSYLVTQRLPETSVEQKQVGNLTLSGVPKNVDVFEKKIAGKIVALLPEDDVNNGTGTLIWHAEYDDGEEGDLNVDEADRENEIVQIEKN